LFVFGGVFFLKCPVLPTRWSNAGDMV
jgi:hypothetical protein